MKTKCLSSLAHFVIVRPCLSDVFTECPALPELLVVDAEVRPYSLLVLY